jgi:peptidyl-prolyl cis-trans isomerase D
MLKYMRMGNKRIKAIWWILTVITVVTFVFLFGTAFDPRYTRKASGAVAVVDGTPVTRPEYETVLADTRAQFRRQYGTDPSEEDQRLVEAQAWRSAVTQTLLDQQARKLGLGAHDAEVVTQLKLSPPPVLAMSPEFQTDGKFDPNKYKQALMSPSANWAPFEEIARKQLPAQKLQERLAASLKLSQPELLAMYQGLTETVAGTVVSIPPQGTGPAPQVTDADLDRIYEKYKNRMATNERAQVEVLQSPRQYSKEELRVAREQAQAIADRARKGEDFAMLAKDYSEGSGAQSGGVVDRVFQPNDFGPLAAQMAASTKDEVLDPIEQAGRFIVFKVLDRPAAAGSPIAGIKVAQVVIKARMSDDSVREQMAKLDKVRARAVQVGLGKAATEAGLTTTKSPWFDLATPPQQMFDAPEAFDFAITHKKGDVSPVLAGSQSFVVVQMADRQAAGISSKDEVKAELTQLAELDKRVMAAKPVADKVAAELAAGHTLEQAAAAAGIVPLKITAMSRMQPDPRLNATPEVVGTLFGAPQGKVIGPIQTPTGWFFVRRDGLVAADTTLFDQQKKGQLSQQILSQRQQDFFTSWLASVRSQAKVEDLRQTATSQ